MATECPFCGSMWVVAYFQDENNVGMVCDAGQGGCGARGPFTRNAVDALEAWNRRAPEPAVPKCPDCNADVLYECVACSAGNYPAPEAESPDVRLVIIERDGIQAIRQWENIADLPPGEYLLRRLSRREG